jgi:hypothetical protein
MPILHGALGLGDQSEWTLEQEATEAARRLSGVRELRAVVVDLHQLMSRTDPTAEPEGFRYEVERRAKLIAKYMRAAVPLSDLDCETCGSRSMQYHWVDGRAAGMVCWKCKAIEGYDAR